MLTEVEALRKRLASGRLLEPTTPTVMQWVPRGNVISAVNELLPGSSEDTSTISPVSSIQSILASAQPSLETAEALRVVTRHAADSAFSEKGINPQVANDTLKSLLPLVEEAREIVLATDVKDEKERAILDRYEQHLGRRADAIRASLGTDSPSGELMQDYWRRAAALDDDCVSRLESDLNSEIGRA